MESFLVIFKEMGKPADRELAQRLWDITRRTDRTAEEQALVSEFHTEWWAYQSAKH